MVRKHLFQQNFVEMIIRIHARIGGNAAEIETERLSRRRKHRAGRRDTREDVRIDLLPAKDSLEIGPAASFDAVARKPPKARSPLPSCGHRPARESKPFDGRRCNRINQAPAPSVFPRLVHTHRPTRAKPLHPTGDLRKSARTALPTRSNPPAPRCPADPRC